MGDAQRFSAVRSAADILPVVLPLRSTHPSPSAEHPSAREPWFKELPEMRRDEFTKAWLSDSARYAELDRRELRRGWYEAAQMVALFAVADFLCPDRTVSSVLEALLAGALVGGVSHRLDLARFSTCALGLLTMITFQWSTRGGLTLLHVLVFYPFASACALLGYLREENGRD